MAIGFRNIPADIRVPLFYAEMDNSAAHSASSTMRRLIAAQVNDTSPHRLENVLVSTLRWPRHWRPRLDARRIIGPFARRPDRRDLVLPLPTPKAPSQGVLTLTARASGWFA